MNDDLKQQIEAVKSELAANPVVANPIPGLEPAPVTPAASSPEVVETTAPAMPSASPAVPAATAAPAPQAAAMPAPAQAAAPAREQWTKLGRVLFIFSLVYFIGEMLWYVAILVPASQLISSISDSSITGLVYAAAGFGLVYGLLLLAYARGTQRPRTLRLIALGFGAYLVISSSVTIYEYIQVSSLSF